MVDCGHKGMHTVNSNTQVGCGLFKPRSAGVKVARKYHPHHHAACSTYSSLNRRQEAGWIHDSCRLHQSDRNLLGSAAAVVHPHQGSTCSGVLFCCTSWLLELLPVSLNQSGSSVVVKISSLWETQSTNNQFELNLFNTSAWLHAVICSHMIGWWDICINEQVYRCT